jgi:hypothetical protein
LGSSSAQFARSERRSLGREAVASAAFGIDQDAVVDVVPISMPSKMGMGQRNSADRVHETPVAGAIHGVQVSPAILKWVPTTQPSASRGYP